MGRFALELWIGRELIDRVRFDFPLIAAEESPGVTRRPLHDAPSLVPHAIARIRVSVPASPRATRLVLVDRATEKMQELPWPPDRQAAAPTPSASERAPSVPAGSDSALTGHWQRAQNSHQRVMLRARFCAWPSVLAPHRIPLSFR